MTEGDGGFWGDLSVNVFHGVCEGAYAFLLSYYKGFGAVASDIEMLDKPKLKAGQRRVREMVKFVREKGLIL